jgi:predicted O-methyltransferase YrrM
MENLEIYWEESKNFNIQQKKPEWLEFIKEITKKGKLNKVLEIGCYDGGTTIFLSNICNSLITIDQPKEPRFDTFKYHIGNTNIFGTNLLNTKTNFSYIGGNSHNTLTFNKVVDLLGGEELDLLFIDGDHSYNGVKEDFKVYSRLVKEGGYIAFHDIHRSSFHESHGCFVHDFWDEVKGFYSHKEFYDNTENSVWGGIGLILNFNKKI